MNKLLFIGPLNLGGVPNNGASIKNNYIIRRLKECGYDVKLVDTEKWRKNPIVLLKVIILVLFSSKSNILISTSFRSAYKLIKLCSKVINPQRIFYWVIGGALAEKIEENNLSKEVYKKIKVIIVEGWGMKNNLMKIGIDNTIVLPNFKDIPYLPILPKENRDTIRFLFLSRIVPQKGCDLIIEACKILNREGLEKKFTIDFYGSIANDYREEFEKKICSLSNVKYKGFIDLREVSNYDILSDYDVFLFPTYWPTEGFPGILIDAMISGLPVIASDWNMNKELIKDGTNGIIIKSKNVKVLVDTMRKVIISPAIMNVMRATCQEKAREYETENVLSPTTLKNIGFD